jgi:apolipoprotein N-acyltransferase
MPAAVSIKALAERLQSLAGWRRSLVAFVAGAVSVLAMAPFFLWPVLWLTLPTLVWLIDAALLARPPSFSRRRESTPPRSLEMESGASAGLQGDDAVRWYSRPEFAAAAVGWWFGFGYLLLGLFWVGEAFLVEAEIFAVLLPFAVTLLPAGLALYFGAATGVASCFWREGPSRALVLALALSAAEWLRGHAFSGFPWNVLGYALTYPLPLMQSAAVLGIYGLTLVAVLIFTLPPLLWAAAPPGMAGRRRRVLAVAVAVGPLAVIALLGQLRLSYGTQATVPDVKLRIVQPSVPQREKWRAEFQERIFRDHLSLSTTDASGQTNSAGITHIIWPEAAVPFLVLDYPAARTAIGDVIPPGAQLILGALRAEPAPAGGAKARRVFNSILVLGEGGVLTGLYDKIHLVPFGEYLPLQGTMEAVGLQQLSRLRGGFDAGERPRALLQVPGLPAAAPLVCYEAIFPRAIVQGGVRPGLMLNVTNDGWFGDTTGPRQHLHQARVRAVEEGLPLVRAANNGISAVVDGYGRMLANLGLDVRGVIDAALPAALAPPLYARLGDVIFLLAWLLGAAAAMTWK